MSFVIVILLHNRKHNPAIQKKTNKRTTIITMIESTNRPNRNVNLMNCIIV